MNTVAASVCPHDCPSACGLEVELSDARTVSRIRGANDHPYTDGVICAKVARYPERVHHPDRLATPLLRIGDKGEARFAPIGWEEALDRIADRFRAATDQYGPETVYPYHYGGSMGLIQLGALNRLRNELGYTRQGYSICTAAADAGWLGGVGLRTGVDAREMAKSDLIVLWGCNAVHTQVNVMHWITRARRERGAKVVVVDPYRNATAEKADLHLMLRPGTDGALACAVMHVLLRDGLADRPYLADMTDFSPELEAHLAARDPAWAAAITGIPATEIEAFARLYGSTKRSYLRCGYGFTRSRNGSAQMHAVVCLPAITGAWTVEGGGALYAHGGVTRIPTATAEAAELARDDVRLIDMVRLGPALAGDPADLGKGPPVTAMIVQNSNPAQILPDTGLVRRGLAREDLFLVVHDQFMTETARFADIVLPATTFLEHDDIYPAGAHTFLGITRAVIPPFAEARSNHDVVNGLGARLGCRHRAFSMTAWDLMDDALRAAGLPDAETALGQHWIDRALPFEKAHFLDGFGHADKRFHFAPDWAAVGARHEAMPRFPDHQAVIDEADEERPFRLVTAPARNFLNTSFTEMPTSRRQERHPTVLVHPADCAALGLAEGDAVRIGNARGSVTVRARPFDGVRRGVVVVESVWPSSAFPEGTGINVLTAAELPVPRGGAPLHDTAVWLARA